MVLKKTLISARDEVRKYGCDLLRGDRPGATAECITCGKTWTLASSERLDLRERWWLLRHWHSHGCSCYYRER